MGRLLESGRHMHGEEQTIRQTRQLVVVRQVVEVMLFLQELRFYLASYADIVSGEGQDMAGGQVETVPPDFHVEERSVLAKLANLERHAGVGIPKFSQ